MTYGAFELTYAAAPDRYEHIPFRRTGRSGLDLPAISFGLWQKFGRDHAFETQREILLHAFDLGITHFDNADRYGPPHRAAQQNFGRVLARDLAPYRDELILSTKAGNPIGPSPYLKGGSRKSILASLEHSLRDLGTDYVDIFYHHSPDLSTPLEETVGALVGAVQQGKALYVGISNYLPDRAHEAAELLRQAGVPLLIHQARYSLYDRETCGTDCCCGRNSWRASLGDRSAVHVGVFFLGVVLRAVLAAPCEPFPGRVIRGKSGLGQGRAKGRGLKQGFSGSEKEWGPPARGATMDIAFQGAVR